jgi:hypothetical protein
MNGAVEDLLREGLDRFTADVQVPPGMTSKARTHLRHRKIAARAALAGVAAAATATAVVVATAPGEGSAGPLQARTTAYVVSRVTSALAETNKVMVTRTTFSAPFPPVMEWAYRGDFRMTQSGFIAPAQDPGMPWAQGRVDWRVGTTKMHGKLIYVQADYRHHEWYRMGAMNYAPDGCRSPLDIVEFNGPSDWAHYLRQALSCGRFTVAGHAWIGGVRTIKLVGSTVDRHFWTWPHAVGRGPLRVTGTLYVEPKTYLPVLVAWDNLSHWKDGRTLRGSVRQAIGMLPATPGNVAKADVTIPATFHRVPRFAFGGPVWPYFTSG